MLPFGPRSGVRWSMRSSSFRCTTPRPSIRPPARGSGTALAGGCRGCRGVPSASPRSTSLPCSAGRFVRPPRGRRRPGTVHPATSASLCRQLAVARCVATFGPVGSSFVMRDARSSLPAVEASVERGERPGPRVGAAGLVDTWGPGAGLGAERGRMRTLEGTPRGLDRRRRHTDPRHRVKPRAVFVRDVRLHDWRERRKNVRPSPAQAAASS